MEISVSVVIPAHNAEDTLARALDSVLSPNLPARRDRRRR
jgi:glycosyltransferase involved in cell wall biosynthesis